mmetsp:Transcript_92357/g.245361  ORF Transcript_92357/g.245361 Transcript_92357/m.245361 type:complete len:179 (-) Transcript_92357:98-634(-)
MEVDHFASAQHDARLDADMVGGCDSGMESAAGVDALEQGVVGSRSDEEDEDVGADYEDFWAGANAGIPVAERHDLARECVVGDRQISSGSYLGLLRSAVRSDRRLLRDRLSHLAEGQYDLQADVVRPHWKLGGGDQSQLSKEIATARVPAACAVEPTFVKRTLGTAKANARRALGEDD